MKTRSSMMAVVVVLTLLAFSCASSVSIEEFEAYKQTNREEITRMQSDMERLQTNFIQKSEFDALRSKVDALELRVQQLETMATQVASEQEVKRLGEEVGVLSADFASLHHALDQFVQAAGYTSPEDLLRLGTDIVNVNKNIAALQQRLDKLRDAMALFVE